MLLLLKLSRMFYKAHHDDRRVLVGQLFLNVLSKGGVDRHPCTRAWLVSVELSIVPWLGSIIKAKKLDSEQYGNTFGRCQKVGHVQ